MYFVDKHVAEMLFDIKEDENLPGNIIKYKIPGFTSDTVITGEWVPRQNELFFLCHKWENGVKKN